MTESPVRARRRFLRDTAHLVAASALPMLSAPARAAAAPRALALVHTHTRERIDLVYSIDDRYVPQALASLDHFLRDHYTGDVGSIDPRVFDLLHDVQRLLGAGRSFEVISGYRCPVTNARLRETGGGGVARHSLHMEGRAVDVRLPGVSLADLRDAGVSLGVGGVGFYPREQFIHLDTGRVRAW